MSEVLKSLKEKSLKRKKLLAQSVRFWFIRYTNLLLIMLNIYSLVCQKLRISQVFWVMTRCRVMWSTKKTEMKQEALKSTKLRVCSIKIHLCSLKERNRRIHTMTIASTLSVIELIPSMK